METDWLPIQQDAPFIRMHRTGQGLDEGRLARAIIADNGQDFPRIEVEITMVQCCHTSVALYQTFCLQDWISHDATFLIHWSTATAPIIRAPINK